VNCNRCGASRDTTDNFCRKCGHQLTITVPAVRPGSSALPAKSAPLPTSVVGGVAVLALTTGVEWVMRRMANNAARAAGRALVTRNSTPLPAKGVSAAAPDVTVDEIVYVRKVQLRR